MTYNTLTDQEKERIFAEDMLGWEPYPGINGKKYLNPNNNYCFVMWAEDFHPLTDLNHAMLGVEKLRKEYTVEIVGENNWMLWLHTIKDTAVICYSDNLNEAIVEACIKIKRPDLFEGE